MRAHGESLVIGMTLVPGLFSRNRSFALFEDPDVRRACRRAALLRGIVRHLAGTQGAIESLCIARGAEVCELSYSLPGMKVHRRTSLNHLEVSCLYYLAGRAGVPGLSASDDDRAAIDAALTGLAVGLRLAAIEELNG